MTPAIVKYPRTRHVAGSKLQPGDADLSQVPIARLAGRPLVIEEKLDGANAALSFDATGKLLLQSRGHYLRGGRREKHFALFKTWAQRHAPSMFDTIGDRFVVYGEWLFAKHTVYYDSLPHWFLEFDVYDRVDDVFLSTPRRRALLAPLAIEPVPVLHQGRAGDVAVLRRLIGPSRFKTPRWRQRLRQQAMALQLDAELIGRQTDPDDDAEGLYIKHEEDGVVAGRYKFVRETFLQAVVASDSHWLNRPIVPNRLADGVDIFAT